MYFNQYPSGWRKEINFRECEKIVKKERILKIEIERKLHALSALVATSTLNYSHFSVLRASLNRIQLMLAQATNQSAHWSSL